MRNYSREFYQDFYICHIIFVMKSSTVRNPISLAMQFPSVIVRVFESYKMPYCAITL